MKKTLTKDQAEILGPLWKQKRAADAQWQAAMALIQVDPDTIVGGDVGADEPYLLLAVEETVTS